MKHVLVAIVAFVVCYAITAFTTMDANPSHWQFEGRVVFVVISSIISALVCIVIGDVDCDDDMWC